MGYPIVDCVNATYLFLGRSGGCVIAKIILGSSGGTSATRWSWGLGAARLSRNVISPNGPGLSGLVAKPLRQLWRTTISSLQLFARTGADSPGSASLLAFDPAPRPRSISPIQE